MGAGQNSRRSFMHILFVLLKGLECWRRPGIVGSAQVTPVTSLRGRTLKFSFHKNVIEDMQRPSVLCHFSAGFI